jgi:cytochrome c oxidase cbb3-type subunit IV
MDYSVFGGIMTVVMMIIFLAIVAWAWSARRRAAFEAAARLPLEEDAPGAASAGAAPQDREV